MAITHLSQVDFSNIPILNITIQNVGALPSAGNKGRLLILTTDNHVYYDNGTTFVDIGSATVPDADATTKGILKLTNDLGGTAALPTVVSVGGASAANIADAVTKRHTQNTDTGTTQTTFQINSGSSGPKLKDSSGELQVRNAADSADANLKAGDIAATGNVVITGNLTVNGTNTILNTTTMETGDNEMVLNSEITTAAGNTSGGIAVKRLDTDNTTRRDAKFLYDETTDRWQATFGVHTAAQITRDVVLKYSALIGDGATTAITIAASVHGLGAIDTIQIVVRDASTGQMVLVDNSVSSAGLVTLTFTTAPASNAYRVTLVG